MSDDELFENWWRVHSPPGTFDKAQCKIAFIAGLVTQRVEAAQQSVHRTECPRCVGKGYFIIGSDECKCPNCNGTGIRR